jgi:hypothetical protein
MNITADHAIMLLEDLASNEDPIIYRGEECCPRDLDDRDSLRLAKYVRISYWNILGHKVHGTLLGMVKDRLKY